MGSEDTASLGGGGSITLNPKTCKAQSSNKNANTLAAAFEVYTCGDAGWALLKMGVSNRDV